MGYRFRKKLFFIMLLFAIAISLTILIIDYMKIKENIMENNLIQLRSIEDTVDYSLRTIEKTYFYFDEETASHLLFAIKETIDNKKGLIGLNVSSSIGMSLSSEHGHDLELLYNKADAALYASKGQGKNQFQVYRHGLNSRTL